ncbi:hypothetical protein Tco_0215003 [Tanacetum coccineum]
MHQQQLIEEYEYICRCLEKDRLLSAQYNLFRPKPAITEPPSNRQSGCTVFLHSQLVSSANNVILLMIPASAVVVVLILLLCIWCSKENRRRKYLPTERVATHVYREDPFFCNDRINRISVNPEVNVGLDLWRIEISCDSHFITDDVERHLAYTRLMDSDVAGKMYPKSSVQCSWIYEWEDNGPGWLKASNTFETINIELKHSVAILVKENETLKKHYKELYDSIKTTRAKTIEHTTSLIAQNVEFKAQLQEKRFAIATLQNDFKKINKK